MEAVRVPRTKEAIHPQEELESQPGARENTQFGQNANQSPSQNEKQH
jgi:hypothetical protein